MKPLSDEELERFRKDMQCDRYPDGVATRLLAEREQAMRDAVALRDSPLRDIPRRRSRSEQEALKARVRGYAAELEGKQAKKVWR